MFAIPTIFTVVLSTLFLHDYHANAEPQMGGHNENDSLKSPLAYDLNTCEAQLSKYRRFMLQAIVTFEDVCDAYSTKPATPMKTDNADADPAVPFRSYQPPARRSDLWAFFKMFMAQFNDVEFANVIRDAIVERCHMKLLQPDEKRNSMVLGKKQRFHSWGGKRSSVPFDVNTLQGFFSPNGRIY